MILETVRIVCTSNGTEYFPYEAVYAIGEVKSTYKSEDGVIEFCKKIEHLKLNLKREKIPQGFISTGRGRGVQLQGLSSDRRPYKNTLFTFMVFANSGKFRKQHRQDLYRSKSVQELPCILCFLDSGVFGYGIVNERGQFSGLHEMPEFASLYQKNWPDFTMDVVGESRADSEGYSATCFSLFPVVFSY